MHLIFRRVHFAAGSIQHRMTIVRILIQEVIRLWYLYCLIVKIQLYERKS
jgi:hypothetical protein